MEVPYIYICFIQQSGCHIIVAHSRVWEPDWKEMNMDLFKAVFPRHACPSQTITIPQDIAIGPIHPSTSLLISKQWKFLV